MDGHRLLALDAALGGLVAGAGVEVGMGFGGNEVQPVAGIGGLAGRHVVRQGIDRAAGLVFVRALPEQREHEVAGLLGDRGAELDLARRGREVAFGVRGVLVGGGQVRVFNDRGQFVAQARITDEIAPGVVMAPMGAWRKNAKGHSTVNAVNPFVFADLGNAPTFSDTKVEIEPVE
jgi:hypothetical protein